MLRSVKNFVRRNRTNIAIGVGIAGAAYFYARSKVTEAKDRMSGDRRAKEYLKRRFEQNQEDCSVTVLELLPQVVDAIMKDLPVERITGELQQKKASKLARSGSISQGVVGESSAGSLADSISPSPAPRNDDDNQSLQSFASESYIMGGYSVEGSRRGGKSRTQLWNEIKNKSITRSFTLIYTLALLTILTRVQLNLLGRKNYLSSVVSLSEREDSPTINLVDSGAGRSYTHGIDAEINRQYLIFSWWFLNRGWKRVKDKVETAVKEVFGPYNARDAFTLHQLHTLTLEVRRKIEIDDGPKWITTYLLPKPSEERIVFSEFGYTVPTTTDANYSSPCPSPIPSSSQSQEYTASPALRQMLDETGDLLDSPIAGRVVRTMLDSGFSVLVEARVGDQVFRKLDEGSTIEGAPKIEVTEPGNNERDGQRSQSEAEEREMKQVEVEKTAKLASVLAVMTREANAIGGRAPNDYLQVMELGRDLEGFSALVYANFEEDVSQRDLTA